MNPSNPVFQAKFKALFENEKKRLLVTVREASAEFSVQTDDLMDEADFTSFEIESQMRMRLRSREALYLKKIDEALERIQAGTFGLCGDCEEPIEMRRLEARPTTTACVSCKEAAERSEHAHIDGHRPKSLGRKIKLA